MPTPERVPRWRSGFRVSTASRTRAASRHLEKIYHGQKETTGEPETSRQKKKKKKKWGVGGQRGYLCERGARSVCGYTRVRTSFFPLPSPWFFWPASRLPPPPSLLSLFLSLTHTCTHTCILCCRKTHVSSREAARAWSGGAGTRQRLRARRRCSVRRLGPPRTPALGVTALTPSAGLHHIPVLWPRRVPGSRISSALFPRCPGACSVPGAHTLLHARQDSTHKPAGQLRVFG